jgi:hypothetical protein
MSTAQIVAPYKLEATKIIDAPFTGAPASSELLSFNPETYLENFGRVPFLVNHNLCSHPLLQQDRILELSRTLPEDCIEYNAGQIPISIDNSLTPRNGLSVEETIRRIAECKSWMVLKYVEKDPHYNELLQECLKIIRPYTDPIYPGMTKPHAFIFLTSPGSVTPYHIDPEHNFLLQIQGDKEIHLYDGRETSVLNEVELEKFYHNDGRNLVYKPEHENHSWTFKMTPGQGLHFPVTYPHYVKNLDEISISFSITFRTPDLDRRQALYNQNAEIRRWGGNPPAVGTSPFRDAMMFNSYRLWRKAKNLLGK